MTKKEMSEIKNYLQSYLDLQNNIRILENLTCSLESDHARLIAYLDQLLRQKGQACLDIANIIESLESETEKNIMTLKYLSGYTWETISELTNYSLRQVYNIHNSALSKLTVYKWCATRATKNLRRFLLRGLISRATRIRTLK